MSVFFSTGPPPADPHLARLWDLLAGEAFADAARHRGGPYGDRLAEHVAALYGWLAAGR